MDTADFHSHSHDHSSPYPHEHSHTHSHDHDHRDHGPRDLAPNGDSIMDESFYPPGGSDSAQIYTSLSSYHAYRRLAHSSLTHTRRQTFYSLPLAQQTLLSAPPISFLETLNTLDAAISDNADLADRIFEVSVDCFGVERDVVRDSRFARLVTAEEMEKVRSTLKQFYRDWSSEGGEERRVAYGPVMEELERRFGSLGPEEK